MVSAPVRTKEDNGAYVLVGQWDRCSEDCFLFLFFGVKVQLSALPELPSKIFMYAGSNGCLVSCKFLV